MVNQEMGPRDPQEGKKEKEQAQEEILKILKEAIEKGREVAITQSKADGFITNSALPISIEGEYLTVEADGYGFDIEINSIERIEPSAWTQKKPEN